MSMDWFNQLATRLQGYAPWQVAVELLVIGAIVYATLRFLRGTRAAGALGAMLLLLLVGAALVRLASQRDLFPRLNQLYTRFVGFSAIALVVVFQPELRRALIRLAELPVARPLLRGMPGSGEMRTLIDAVVAAASFLSKNRFGAILAIERQVGLRELTEGATPLHADLTPELLESIFWPSNPLHDMGVVIKGRKIIAAGVQFPLADQEDVRDPTLGTRHRAAVGLSRVSDAVVVVISEETGAISLCERGALVRWLTPEALRAELSRLLAAPNPYPLAAAYGDRPAEDGSGAGDTAMGLALDDAAAAHDEPAEQGRVA